MPAADERMTAAPASSSGSAFVPRDVPGALHALLGGIVDYAGLFPPASLAMQPAVQAYADYRRSSDHWALGRFVVPVARLAEFEAAATPVLGDVTERGPWRLSALGGIDLSADVAAIRDFGMRHSPAVLVIDSIELRAGTPDVIARAAGLVGSLGDPAPLLYVELPIARPGMPSTSGNDAEIEALLSAVSAAGVRAKVRTGGVSADAIPDVQPLARFIRACVRAGVPFKATAGLHHPLRANYRLTYAADAPSATMYGFFNVFLASAFAGGASLDLAAVSALLLESDLSAIAFDDAGVTWRGHRLTSEQLAAARRDTILSFGSCSFREPMDELQAMGLLPRLAPPVATAVSA